MYVYLYIQDSKSPDLELVVWHVDGLGMFLTSLYSTYNCIHENHYLH